MKKISINLLKVGLYLILGLYMFSARSEVTASDNHLRTYYANLGQEIKIESTYRAYDIYDENFSRVKTSLAGKLENNKFIFTIPTFLTVNKSYYIYTQNSVVPEYAEIYIMPKHILTDMQGNTNISMSVGEKEQIKFKYEGEKNLKNIGSIVYSEEESNYVKTSSVVFASSNPSVASVDKNTGLITAKGEGTATITMTRTIQQDRYVKDNWHRARSTFEESIQVTVADNAPKYSITLDYNGGTDKEGKSEVNVEDNDGVVTLQDYVNDERFLLKREGYELTGWKSGDTTYKKGDKVEFSGNIIFVAQWKKLDTGTDSVKVEDCNNVEFSVGDFVKFTDKTNDGGWNLRETARGKSLGEIKSGTMLEITEVSTTDICIKVKVLDGDLEGKEGWLTISKKQNFEIIKNYTGEEAAGEDDGLGSDEGGVATGIDLGQFSGIFEIIWNLISAVLKNLPGIIAKITPYIESGAEIAGNLLTQIIQR